MDNNCKFSNFLPQIASGWPLSPLWTRYGGKQVLKYSLSLYENLAVLYLFISYGSTSISCISHPPPRNLFSGPSTRSRKCFILMSQAQREWMVDTPFLEASELRGAPVWVVGLLGWGGGGSLWFWVISVAAGAVGPLPAPGADCLCGSSFLCRRQMLPPQRLI